MPRGTVFPARAFPPGRIQRGLTSWWPLDGNNSQFATSGIGGNSLLTLPKAGAIYGTGGYDISNDGPPANVSGPVVNFKGTTTQVITLSASPVSPTYTLASAAFWINFADLTAADGNPRIMCFNTSDFAVNQLSGQIGFTGNTGTLLDLSTSAAVVAINSWYHVAVTVTNPTSAKIYINGVSVATGAGIGAGGLGGSVIGGAASAARLISAKMFDVMVFDGTLLTASEVASLYSSYFLPVEEMPALFVAAGGGFTPIYRKTLSSLGTRIGARQSQVA